MTNEVKLPRETYTAALTTTNDTQVCLAPWMNSKNGTLRWKKLCLTNNHASNVAKVTFWDEHLTVSTPGSYGSTSAPLFTVNVAAGASIQISELSLPAIQFIAGIAADTDNVNVSITVEVEIEIL